MRTVLRSTVGLTVVLLAAAACGGDDGAAGGTGPQIVVTTNILGDVVQQLVGGAVEVDVLMPPGANPHDFALSARQGAQLRDADVVVVNGLGFEAGLVDTIDAAADDGAHVVTATDAVDVLPLPEGGAGDDPHFFTDPVRMAAAVEHIAEELAATVDGLDTPAFRDRVTAYLHDLEALDAEVEAILATVPPAQRTLVTNHEVFGYFADRYGFDVLGAVIPGGTTLAEPSGADLAALAQLVEDAGVRAIFAETSAPTRLADALAAEGADVEVVEVYSESLGEAGTDGATYLGMVRANAERIAAALR
jgi:zinc/manganese transport system substrate-binding protein